MDNKKIEIKITEPSPIPPIHWEDETVSVCLHIQNGKVKVVISPKKLVLYGDNENQVVITLEGASLENESPKKGQAKLENSACDGDDWEWKKIS